MTDQDAYEKMSDLNDRLRGEQWNDLPHGVRLATQDEMTCIERDFPGTLCAVQEAAFCAYYDI